MKNNKINYEKNLAVLSVFKGVLGGSMKKAM